MFGPLFVNGDFEEHSTLSGLSTVYIHWLHIFYTFFYKLVTRAIWRYIFDPSWTFTFCQYTCTLLNESNGFFIMNNVYFSEKQKNYNLCNIVVIFLFLCNKRQNWVLAIMVLVILLERKCIIFLSKL